MCNQTNAAICATSVIIHCTVGGVFDGTNVPIMYVLLVTTLKVVHVHVHLVKTMPAGVA